MDEINKMIITEANGNRIEVDIITRFFNKANTKEYIMYTKNEMQEESTIVYISRLTVENDNYIDEIENDTEWAEVKSIIRELIA